MGIPELVAGGRNDSGGEGEGFVKGMDMRKKIMQGV